nr:ATP-binding cassette sub-family G member 4-like [Rhipicephalus microplus]
MASANTSERETTPSPKNDQQTDKGTATTFSDSELLRKVQFPVPKGSREAVKTAPPGSGLAEELRTTICWNDISCTVPIVRGIFEKTVDSMTKPMRRKTAVRCMSGCAGPGDLVAILGPPNSGKSTLLNILSGYCREGYSGEVLINGTVVGVDELSERSCCVPQRDLHLDCFSVKETLWIAAELKFPTSGERKDKFRAVVNAMERWGLMDVRRIPVSMVSKTHRRLLTCAEQLIRPQPLIFVDDPTRNVDATQAHICLRTLKYLAYKGHTVIVVISNPTSVMLKYITKVYVLAEGRLIYSGLPADMRNHLGAHGFICPLEVSITEYLLQVAAKMYGGLRALAETETIKAKEMKQSGPCSANGIPESGQLQSVTVERKGSKAGESVDANEEGGKAPDRRRNSLGNIFESRETVDNKDLFSLLFNRFIFYTFRSSVYMSYRQFINISFIVIFANVFNSVGVEHNFTNMNVAFVFLYMSGMSAFSLLSSTLKILAI